MRHPPHATRSDRALSYTLLVDGMEVPPTTQMTPALHLRQIKKTEKIRHISAIYANARLPTKATAVGKSGIFYGHGRVDGGRWSISSFQTGPPCRSPSKLALLRNVGGDLKDPLRVLCFGQPSCLLNRADVGDPFTYVPSWFLNLPPAESSSARPVLLSMEPPPRPLGYHFRPAIPSPVSVGPSSRCFLAGGGASFLDGDRLLSSTFPVIYLLSTRFVPRDT